jgi:putative transcriptional regulator
MSRYNIAKYYTFLYNKNEVNNVIVVKIKDQLEKQGKTIYWLSKETGISNNNLAKLANNETESIKFEVMEKICKALDCHLVDIIDYIKD